MSAVTNPNESSLVNNQPVTRLAEGRLLGFRISHPIQENKWLRIMAAIMGIVAGVFIILALTIPGAQVLLIPASIFAVGAGGVHLMGIMDRSEVIFANCHRGTNGKVWVPPTEHCPSLKGLVNIDEYADVNRMKPEEFTLILRSVEAAERDRSRSDIRNIFGGPTLPADAQ